MEINIGEVVLVDIIFSDLSEVKKRPVLIIKQISQSDYLGLPVTSQTDLKNEWEMIIKSENFKSGNLPVDAKILFNKPSVFSRNLIHVLIEFFSIF